MKIPENHAFLDRNGVPRPEDRRVLKAMYRDCHCGHCGKLGVEMQLVGFLVENKLRPLEDGGALVFNLIRCFHCKGRLDERGAALEENGDPVKKVEDTMKEENGHAQ